MLVSAKVLTHGCCIGTPCNYLNGLGSIYLLDCTPNQECVYYVMAHFIMAFVEADARCARCIYLVSLKLKYCPSHYKFVPCIVAADLIMGHAYYTGPPPWQPMKCVCAACTATVSHALCPTICQLTC